MNTANKKILFLFVFVHLDYVFLVLSAPNTGTPITETDGFNVPFKIYDKLYRECVMEFSDEPFHGIPKDIKVMIDDLYDKPMGLGTIVVTKGTEMKGLRSDVLMHLHCFYQIVKNDKISDANNLLAVAYVQQMARHFTTLFFLQANDYVVNYTDPVPKNIRKAFFDDKMKQLTMYLMTLGHYGPKTFKKLLPEGVTSKKEIESGLEELNEPLVKSEVLSKEEADKVKWAAQENTFVILSPPKRISDIWSPKSPKPPSVIFTCLTGQETKSLNELFAASFSGCYIPPPENHNLTQLFKIMEKIKDLNLWKQELEENESSLTYIIKSIIRVTSETNAESTSTDAASTSTVAASTSTGAENASTEAACASTGAASTSAEVEKSD